MKVKNLIKKLQKVDPEMDVIIGDFYTQGNKIKIIYGSKTKEYYDFTSNVPFDAFVLLAKDP